MVPALAGEANGSEPSVLEGVDQGHAAEGWASLKAGAKRVARSASSPHATPLALCISP